jgi:hypothetical protein
MSEATIAFAMLVVSMSSCYLENIEIKNIRNLTAENVSYFWVSDIFSCRKPMGVQAYAYKLKNY